MRIKNAYRSRKQQEEPFQYFLVDSYQLWHKDVSWDHPIRSLIGDLWVHSQNFFWNIMYSLKKFLFLTSFLLNRPERFER